MYPPLERPGLAALDPLAELEYAIDELAEVDHREVSGHERRTRVMRLHRLQNRVDAERLRLVEVVDRSGDAIAVGAVNTRAWLRHECGLASGAAGRDVRAARRLEEFPAWTKAYAAGTVNRGQVDVLVKAATAERVERLAEHETLLLEQAKKLSPDDFARTVSHACEVIDADNGPNETREQIERRRLHLSKTLDGMWKLDGVLDPESGEVLNTALEHFMALDPDKPGEKRPISQRRADAAVSMARYVLVTSEPSKDKSRRGRPDVLVTADLGRLAADKTDLVAAIRDEVRDAGRLSTETLLRLTCDCNISRVLMAGPIRSPRRRPHHPHHPTCPLACARRPRRRLHRRRLRRTPLGVRGPPRTTLGPRRRNQPRQHQTQMLALPPQTPRRPSRPRPTPRMSQRGSGAPANCDGSTVM